MIPDPTPPRPDAVRAFIDEILRTGAVLAGLLDDLVDALPEDAYPGEALDEVVLDMMCGSAAPALVAAGVTELQSAHALVGAVGDRVMEDLREAARRAEARERRKLPPSSTT